jgi:hypothetical protein
MVQAGVDQMALWKRLFVISQAPTLELCVTALVDHIAGEPVSGPSDAWVDTCLWIRLLQIGVTSPFDSEHRDREEVLFKVIKGLHQLKCSAPEAWILVLQKLQPRQGSGPPACSSEHMYSEVCACMTTFARQARDNPHCAQLFKIFVNAQFAHAKALGSPARPGPIPPGTSTLDYLKQSAHKFPLTHCVQTAHQITNHLTGKIGVMHSNTIHRFPNADAYLAEAAHRHLFNPGWPDTVFCIDVGMGAHAFLVERVLCREAAPEFLIYQSWEDTFDLAWWLGEPNSWEDSAGHDYHLMREIYGKGNSLNRDDVEAFLQWVTALDPDGTGPRQQITIGGAFRPTGTGFVRNENF